MSVFALHGHRRQAAVVLLVVVLAVLAGCASPPAADNMRVAVPLASLSQAAPATAIVSASGGTDELNANLKSAIERSVVDSRLFSLAGSAPADYRLHVTVVQTHLPVFAAAMTADVELAWSLTKTADGSPVMRKVYNSTFTGGAFDSLSGATRAKMALESSIRRNIESALPEIAAALK